MPTPPPAPEPALAEPTPAAHGRRALAWSALGLVLAGGAVARLTGAAVSSGATSTRGVVALPSLTAAEAAAALAHASFDPAAVPAVLAALRSRRLQLVRAAFYGVGPAVGTAVTVTCGPTTRTITLTPQPEPILLPIERQGTLVITPAAAMAAGARIGLVAATGPGLLPPTAAGQSLTLDVIVL